METVILKCILISSIICAIPGCTENEEDDPAILRNEEILVAVQHSIYGIDSIFYENDQISEIKSYKKSSSELILAAKCTLERYEDQLTVSVQGERPETGIFTFTGSGISEIRCPEENFKAEFHYRDEQVDYLLYVRGEYRDSLAFFYDRKLVNISRMEWYSLNSGNPVLYFTADYTFDDKRNPYNKSVYWLATNWKGPDNIVKYFNFNNIIGIGSHKLSYTYNENDYPLYMDISYYGRTIYTYRPW